MPNSNSFSMAYCLMASRNITISLYRLPRFITSFFQSQKRKNWAIQHVIPTYMLLNIIVIQRHRCSSTRSFLSCFFSFTSSCFKPSLSYNSFSQIVCCSPSSYLFSICIESQSILSHQNSHFRSNLIKSYTLDEATHNDY
jgi:hypothetical protein